MWRAREHKLGHSPKLVTGIPEVDAPEKGVVDEPELVDRPEWYDFAKVLTNRSHRLHQLCNLRSEYRWISAKDHLGARAIAGRVDAKKVRPVDRTEPVRA
jgi:hypothetical protein